MIEELLKRSRLAFRNCIAYAGELIAECTLAVEKELTVSDLKVVVHPHPTLSETIMEASEIFFGQATHIFKPKK